MIRTYALLLLFAVGFSNVNLTAKNKQPNVVLILIDDLSHYGVSAYGASEIGSMIGRFEQEPVSTPRIDKLAQQGLLCNNAFAYPLCESTRIALMSGQNNNRNYLRCKSQHHSDITFGDTFQRAGYATGITGKWKQTRGTKEIPGKDYIYQFGWDEFCCFDVVGENQRYINPDLVINGKQVNYAGRTDLDPRTGRRWYGPDICNNFALDFIEEHKDEPFFLYYPMLLVHDEHKPTPDTKPNAIFDNFDEVKHNRDGHHGDDHRYIADMIMYMDKLIGKVVDKLDTLNLRENTLIIVMGDNGTKEAFYHAFDDGKVYPGRKGGNADNGLHVPLVLSQPGTIPSGENEIRRYDGLVNLTDIYPTIAEASGVQIPNVNSLDGWSFWKQAQGKTEKEHRDYIYTWYNANNVYTSTETIIEYAFDKNFKVYAPDKDYPDGRFFDLRVDPLERVGDKYVELRFKVRHYKGWGLDTLNTEQQEAYNRLSKVLKENQMVAVTGLSISKTPKQVKVGSKTPLRCKVIPANATRKNTLWVSNDPSVLSIDKFGIATAKKKGMVNISVYSWDDAFPQASNSKVSYRTGGIHDQVSIEVK